MSDTTRRTKDEVRAALDKLIEERVTESFLEKVSRPGKFDDFVFRAGKLFDGIEGKPFLPRSGIRA